jgi:hypothetical protein
MTIILLMIIGCVQESDTWSLTEHNGCGDVRLWSCNVDNTRCFIVEVPFELNEDTSFGTLDVDFSEDGVLTLEQGWHLEPGEGCCSASAAAFEDVEESLVLKEVEASLSVEQREDESSVSGDVLGLAAFKASLLRFEASDGSVVNLDGFEMEVPVGCHRD